MYTPQTSVIIPTHDRLPFLRQAVQSVFDQTVDDFELIIVDDGSEDGTRAWAEGLGGRIRCFWQKNRGPGAARNKGITEANGEFITFLDSDDLWQPQKLQRQIELMTRHQEAIVCYTDEIWIRRGVRVNPKQKHQKHAGRIFEQCLPLCIVSPSSVLMRKRFFSQVGLFDESLPACEDYDLWLRAALQFEFHFIDEKLIIKRGGHADQLSAQWGLDQYRVRALMKLLDNPRLTYKTRKLLAKQMHEKCRILEQGFRKRGKSAQANYYAGLLQKFTILQ